MSLSYLDKTGLAALWDKIKAKFVSRSVISTTAADVTSTTSNRYIGNNAIIRNGNVDAYESDNGVSSETWIGLYAQDTHGKNIGKAAPGVNPDGRVKIELYAQNYNSSGTSLGSNVLTMAVDKSGNRSVYVSAPKEWRDALEVIQPKYYGASFKTVSLSNETSFTNLGSMGLGPGIYIVTFTVRFPASKSGYRKINISSTSAGGAINDGCLVMGAPSPSDITSLQITAMFNLTGTMNWLHFNAAQTSGSTMSSVRSYVSYVQVL
jgi:hypothetical protein